MNSHAKLFLLASLLFVVPLWAAAPPPKAPPAKASPANPDLPTGKSHYKLLDDRVINEVREIFRAYELRNIASFRQIVGINLRTTDDNKFGTSGRQLGYAVNCDFSNLRAIEFDIEVFPPVYNPTETIARVTVTWNRRAQFNASGEEWIVRDQKSVLVFDMSSPRPKLITIEQAPLFGLCNQIQVLVIDRGDIIRNGVATPVSAPLSVRNGRLGAGANDIFSFGNFRRFRRTVVPPPAAPAPAAPAPPAPPPPAPTTVDYQLVVATVSAPGNTVSQTGTGSPRFFTTTAQVRNNGTGTAPPNNVTFDDGPQNFVVPFGNLAPGASTVVVSPNFDAAQLPLGAQTVFATVNSANTVAETNAANNTQTVNITVIP